MEKRVDSIIFASRGFATKQDVEKYLEPLEKEIINKFTNIPCYRIFVDNDQRIALYNNDNIFMDDLESSVNLVVSRKIKNLLVVPIMPGYSKWYDKLKRQIIENENKVNNISLCKPIYLKFLDDSQERLVEKELFKNEDAKKILIKNVGEFIKLRKGV